MLTIITKHTSYALVLSALLAGCAGQQTKPDEPVREAPPTAAPSRPAPAVPPAIEPAPSKGSGGYYKDDGPEATPSVDVSKVPDAVPVAEAPIAKLNRPYSALGKEYKPMKGFEPYKERGIASWYGRRFHGNKTASGEVYDMYKMTGAHTRLPIPSYARVTNIANGRSVVVRINDRGPFHKDRLIDLSYAAAYKIGLLVKGSAEVEVEAINPNGGASAKPSSPSNTTSSPNAIPAQTSTLETSTEADETPPPTSLTSEPGFYVQIAAFNESENAEKLKTKVLAQNIADNAKILSWYNAGKYRVRVGPFEARSEAESVSKLIKQKMGISAIIVNQK